MQTEYCSSHYDGHDLEALADLPRYQSWILSHFRRHLSGHVLEYGAGIGNVARMVRPWARRLTLVEPALNLLPKLSARFAGDADVEIRGATIEDHTAEQPDGSFDAVMLINVLEHVADDAAALRQFHRIVRRDGHLLLFVPAMPALYSKMDERLCHYRRYRKGELMAAVAAAGFQIKHCRYFDAVGALAWWLTFTLGGKVEFDPRLAGIFDSVVVPIMRPLETALPPPCGKNLILTACKA